MTTANLPQETLDDLQQELDLILELLISEESRDRTLAEEMFTEHLFPRLENKIDGYIKAIKYRESLAKFQQSEAERISKLAIANNNAIKWLKSKLQDLMEGRVEQLGDRGRILEGKLSKVSLCGNGGKPPVWINPELSEADYPEEFLEFVPRLNKTALVDAVTETGELRDSTGKLIAKALPKGKHLRIS